MRFSFASRTTTVYKLICVNHGLDARGELTGIRIVTLT